jgi:hypothetical protein
MSRGGSGEMGREVDPHTLSTVCVWVSDLCVCVCVCVIDTILPIFCPAMPQESSTARRRSVASAELLRVGLRSDVVPPATRSLILFW